MGHEISQSLNVSFKLEGEKVPYAQLEETLFIEAARFLLRKNSNLSLRGLERATGLPRMTLSRRLSAALKSGRLNQSELPERFKEHKEKKGTQ
jgi:hypothetical protein